MTTKASRHCVVVVEDHADSRSALARLLEMSGYAVRSAAGVREALEVVAAHGCDLLIADLGLPDGSGLDLMRRLRAAHGLERGIALTGFTSPQDERECAEAGFQKFLPKPVSFAAVLTEVQRMLPLA